MFISSRTFVSDYISGECKISDIDDYVEAWHLFPMVCELYQYLGLTEAEYFDWVKNADCLELILQKYTKLKETIDKYRLCDNCFF